MWVSSLKARKALLFQTQILCQNVVSLNSSFVHVIQTSSYSSLSFFSVLRKKANQIVVQKSRNPFLYNQIVYFHLAHVYSAQQAQLQITNNVFPFQAECHLWWDVHVKQAHRGDCGGEWEGGGGEVGRRGEQFLTVFLLSCIKCCLSLKSSLIMYYINIFLNNKK